MTESGKICKIRIRPFQRKSKELHGLGRALFPAPVIEKNNE